MMYGAILYVGKLFHSVRISRFVCAENAARNMTNSPFVNKRAADKMRSGLMVAGIIMNNLHVFPWSCSLAAAAEFGGAREFFAHLARDVNNGSSFFLLRGRHHHQR